jgi:hypothetical protein
MNRLRIVLALTALAAVACEDTQSSLAHTPIRVVFLTNPSNAVANSPIPGSIDIGIMDGTGTVRNDATSEVTITIGNNPGGATLSGMTTLNAVHGIASFTNLTLNQAGTGYTLVAASSGLAPDTSSAFNVTP